MGMKGALKYRFIKDQLTLASDLRKINRGSYQLVSLKSAMPAIWLNCKPKCVGMRINGHGHLLPELHSPFMKEKSCSGSMKTNDS